MTAWYHQPMLTPAGGFYVVLALAAIYGIGFIVHRMLTYRERIEDDPIERQFKERS